MDYEHPYWTKVKGGGQNFHLNVSDELFFSERVKEHAYGRAVKYYDKRERDYPLPPLDEIEDRGEVDESHG